VPPITPNIPTTPPPPPLATPEPGTFVFLFAGMTIVALLVGLTLRRHGSA
jgi:hypothetical protein